MDPEIKILENHWSKPVSLPYLLSVIRVYSLLLLLFLPKEVVVVGITSCFCPDKFLFILKWKASSSEMFPECKMIKHFFPLSSLLFLFFHGFCLEYRDPFVRTHVFYLFIFSLLFLLKVYSLGWLLTPFLCFLFSCFHTTVFPWSFSSLFWENSSHLFSTILI